MYCANCRRQLYHEDLEHYGWCYDCATVVPVSQCKVSYWMIVAVFMMFWVAQVA